MSVSLEVRPANLRFAKDLDPGCKVSLDQRRQGTLGELEFTLLVDRPNVSHILALDCGDGPPTVKTFPYIEPGTYFAATAGP